MSTMLPTFILVELELDQWIVAHRTATDPPTYRKFLTAVGRPAAKRAHVALTEAEDPEDIDAQRDEIIAEARRIEEDRRFFRESNRVTQTAGDHGVIASPLADIGGNDEA